MSLNWLNKGVAKAKESWQASQERARQQALRDKAVRDEAKSYYEQELQKERSSQLKAIAIQKAKIDAKLQAQRVFAPRQNAFGRILSAPGNAVAKTFPKPNERVMSDLNASLSFALGSPSPKKEQLKKSLKAKGVAQSNFNDLIWKS